MTPDDVRRLALAMPEAVEGSHMGHPDFRVRNRIFAAMRPEEGVAVVKLPPEHQRVLLDAEPLLFSPAPGAWGRQGWTRLRLGGCDEATLQDALRVAWRTVAPRRLVATS
ncbi:MmcQ/YjbR family DNA-binding protein [Geminicoccus flavidas]|uniref:MmcQ/YjbR family DNA-binding protein n=1 Tax=Geminicoccus flavidas TaxID=2506407 RepID=UPI001358F0EA|nr:MmcQ/YjbR family DNA-binding protein [Geminicoccus flavidas]